MLTGGDLGVEVRLVGPARSAVRATFASNLVPSAVRILQRNTVAGRGNKKLIKMVEKAVIGWASVPATVYFLTVTSVQWDGENLAVGNNDQFAIIVAAVLGLFWRGKKMKIFS